MNRMMDELYFILDNIEINSYKIREGVCIENFLNDNPNLAGITLTKKEWTHIVTISIGGKIASHVTLNDTRDGVLHIVGMDGEIGKVLVDSIDTIALLERIPTISVTNEKHDNVFKRSGYKQNGNGILSKKIKDSSIVCGVHVQSHIKSIIKKNVAKKDKKVTFTFPGK